MDVYEIYQDCLDGINKDNNGYLSVDLFNRLSWTAQLRLLDWLTGDVAGIVPPLFDTQKNRDWISDFIIAYPRQVENGKATKPSTYYLYQAGYKINGTINNDCDEDAEQEYTIVPNTTITLLDNSKFDLRVNTYIKSLKPTITNAICKVVGRDFVFNPADIGSIGIEYVRYPVRAKLVMKDDIVYNEEVYDSVNSIDFEWQEYARPILTWFIVDSFFNHTTNMIGKQMNAATPKLSRS